MAVTIRIWAYPDSYLVIDGQKVGPGSYQVDRGSSVTFMMNAKNHGTAGSAWLGIRDKDTGEILKWRSYSVSEGQVFYYSDTITIGDNMNLEFVGGQLTNEGRIIQHSYGTWSITVKEEPVPPDGDKGILGLPWYVWVLLLLGAAFLFMRQRGE